MLNSLFLRFAFSISCAVLFLFPGQGYAAEASLDWLIEYAFQHNPEIESLCHKAAAADATVSQEQYRSYLPKINLEGGSVREDLNIRKDSYNYGFVGAEWNLYRGGRDLKEIGNRKLETCIAVLEMEKAKKKLAYEIGRQFYILLYLKQALQLYEEALQGNPYYLKIATKKRDEGMTTDVDVLEIELLNEEQCRQQAELEALFSQHQTELQALLGYCEEEDPLIIEGEFSGICADNDFCEWYNRALENREDWEQGRREVVIHQNKYDQVSASSLPRVDLLASYGYEPDNFADRGQGSKVRLNISFPLGEAFASCSAQRKVAHEWRSRELANQQLENNIAAQIKVSLTALKKLTIQHKCAENRQERVEKYWNLTREEYGRGVKNSPDLANAIVRFVDAKDNLLNLKKEYSLALLDLFQAAGVLPFSCPLTSD